LLLALLRLTLSTLPRLALSALLRLTLTTLPGLSLSLTLLRLALTTLPRLALSLALLRLALSTLPGLALSLTLLRLALTTLPGLALSLTLLRLALTTLPGLALSLALLVLVASVVLMTMLLTLVCAPFLAPLQRGATARTRDGVIGDVRTAVWTTWHVTCITARRWVKTCERFTALTGFPLGTKHLEVGRAVGMPADVSAPIVSPRIFPG